MAAYPLRQPLCLLCLTDSVLLRWRPFPLWGVPRVSLGGVPCAPPPPITLLSRGLDLGVSPPHSGLLRWQPFLIWGGARVSLGGVPGAPLPPMMLLSRGLAARIQTGIFLLGCSHPIRLARRPCTLHSLMGGALAPRHLHPQAPPLFRPFGIIIGGLHSPPLLLLVIMGGLQPPPLFLLVIMVGLPSLPLPLGLCGPRQDRHISHRFWRALLLRPFLHLSPMRSRLLHHW